MSVTRLGKCLRGKPGERPKKSFESSSILNLRELYASMASSPSATHSMQNSPSPSLGISRTQKNILRSSSRTRKTALGAASVARGSCWLCFSCIRRWGRIKKVHGGRCKISNTTKGCWVAPSWLASLEHEGTHCRSRGINLCCGENEYM